MKSEFEFSFIIPCLNEEDNIQACLDSIPHSASLEVIVVDGGSQDSTLSIISESERPFKILKSPVGRAKQMNTGARYARGHVLIFLHADSILPDDCLLYLDNFKNQNLKLWGRFDVALQNERKIFRLIESMINLRSAWSNIATGDQGIFVKREYFDSIGAYPDIPLMEDIALCDRLRQKSVAFRIKSAIETSARRWEEIGVIKTILLMWLFRFLYAFGFDTQRLHNIYYGKEPKQQTPKKELLIIFSKNPEIGKVKTRLIPKIGAQLAYQLYKAMLEQTLKNTINKNLENQGRQFEIWIYGNKDNDYLHELAFQFNLKLKSQVGGELGASLSHTFNSSVENYQSIVVIGGDCVSIEKTYIDAAFSALQKNDVVVGPALDGGFVLVGFQDKSFKELVFANIDWGSSKVLKQFLENAETLQLNVESLEELWDIDDYQDLVLLEPFPWFRELFPNR